MAGNPKIGNGPIPGENYTSDTRNYPWHRPPEITDLDAGVELSVKRLTEKDNAYSLLTMLQAGVSVVQATDMFVTSGIGQGKWTPDFAILLAGPVSHIIKLMADGYGIKYNMGLDNEMPSTIEFLKATAELDPKKTMVVAKDIASQADMFKQHADNQQQPQSPVGLLGAPDTSMNHPVKSGMMAQGGPVEQGQQPPTQPTPQDNQEGMM